MTPIAGARTSGAMRLLVIIAPLMALACPQPVTVDPRIWRMSRCTECQSVEMDSVVAMGASAVPGLRKFLLEGPPDSTVQRQDSAMSAPYSNGGGGRGGRGGRPTPGVPTRTPPPPPLPPPSHAIVQLRLDDFVAMYRIRSSLALGLIGGNAARKALCEGKARQFRPDVARMIDSGLVLLNGTCP